MYEKIRVASKGPQTNKLTAIKSLSEQPIMNKNQLMKRWEKHYSSLYAEERSVNSSLEAAIFQLPEMADLDDEPTEDELLTTIEELHNGKAPGHDKNSEREQG